MERERDKKNIMAWARRLGWIGVIFFTIKGLIWLAVFYGFGKLIGL